MQHSTATHRIRVGCVMFVCDDGKRRERCQGSQYWFGLCVCQHVREHVYIPCVCVCARAEERERGERRANNKQYTHTHIEERKENTLLHTHEKKKGSSQ